MKSNSFLFLAYLVLSGLCIASFIRVSTLNPGPLKISEIPQGYLKFKKLCYFFSKYIFCDMIDFETNIRIRSFIGTCFCLFYPKISINFKILLFFFM